MPYQSNKTATIAQILAAPTMELEDGFHKSYLLGRITGNLELEHHSFYLPLEALPDIENDHPCNILLELKGRVICDSRRSASIYVVTMDKIPIMVHVAAGREEDDFEQTFVLKPELVNEFLLRLVLIDMQKVLNKIKPPGAAPLDTAVKMPMCGTWDEVKLGEKKVEYNP